MSKFDQFLNKWVFLEDSYTLKIDSPKEVSDNVKYHKLLNIKSIGDNVYSVKQKSKYISNNLLSFLLGEIIIKIIDHESEVLIRSKPSKYLSSIVFFTALLFLLILVITLDTQNILPTIFNILVISFILFVHTKVLISLNELVVDKVVSTLKK